MKRCFVIGLVVAIACLPVSCVRDSGAADAVWDAYRRVAAIAPTAAVDGEYADYARRVSEASTAVTACRPAGEEEQAILSHLSRALSAYAAAAQAWETKAAECEDCAWRKFRDGHRTLGLPLGATADDAMRLLWDSAARELAAAREGLEAGD